MTTIRIGKGGEFQTILDFLQSLDISEVLDVRKENPADLPANVQTSLQELEQEGIDDCVNL